MSLAHLFQIGRNPGASAPGSRQRLYLTLPISQSKSPSFFFFWPLKDFVFRLVVPRGARRSEYGRWAPSYGGCLGHHPAFQLLKGKWAGWGADLPPLPTVGPGIGSQLSGHAPNPTGLHPKLGLRGDLEDACLGRGPQRPGHLILPRSNRPGLTQGEVPLLAEPLRLHSFMLQCKPGGLDPVPVNFEKTGRGCTSSKLLLKEGVDSR